MFSNVDWLGLARGEVVTDDNGNVLSLVEFKGRDRDSYGEAYEGDSECYLIFASGDRYYKKYGQESSYNTWVEWEWGQVVQVTPKVIITTVFE